MDWMRLMQTHQGLAGELADLHTPASITLSFTAGNSQRFVDADARQLIYLQSYDSPATRRSRGPRCELWRSQTMYRVFCTCSCLMKARSSRVGKPVSSDRPPVPPRPAAASKTQDAR